MFPHYLSRKRSKLLKCDFQKYLENNLSSSPFFSQLFYISDGHTRVRNTSPLFVFDHEIWHKFSLSCMSILYLLFGFKYFRMFLDRVLIYYYQREGALNLKLNLYHTYNYKDLHSNIFYFKILTCSFSEAAVCTVANQFIV